MQHGQSGCLCVLQTAVHVTFNQAVVDVQSAVQVYDRTPGVVSNNA